MAKISLNANRIGLTLGIFIALLHAIWALLVGVGVGQEVLDWIFPMHFLSSIYTIIQFNVLTAIILIVMAFLAGYVMGYIFALIYNLVEK